MHGCKSVVALPLLLALANCSSPARLSSQLTRVPAVAGSTATAAATVTAQPADGEAAGTTNRSGATVPRQKSAGQEDATSVSGHVGPYTSAIADPSSGWISLETWGESNHFGPHQRWLSAAHSGYDLHTPGGIITVIAGSHIAHWDKVSCWLGYAPRLGNGHLLVHALDARKTFLPLVSTPSFPTDNRRVVVIDPGHGGENTGTRSVADHHLEKEFTLDWALRLQPLLTSNGWQVILTRTNDVDIALAERVAAADRAKADLFVSLHFNSGARQDQAGIETYCLTPAGMPSTLTRDYEDDVTRVFPNNAFDTQNLQYAVRLHRALLEETGADDRGVRRARFMVVLRGQNRPAVLVEGGYLSNLREAQSIADPEYRQKLAEAVAKALLFTNVATEHTLTNTTNQAP